jgi:hypothetical protein
MVVPPSAQIYRLTNPEAEMARVTERDVNSVITVGDYWLEPEYSGFEERVDGH